MLGKQTLLLLATGLLINLGAAAIAQEEPAVVAPAAEDAQPEVLPKMSSLELAAWIDERIELECQRRGIPIPPVVEDETFARRVYLDLIGTIPSVAQLRDFLDETESFKRENLVDRLLRDDRRPEFYAQRHAEHFSRILRRAMIPRDAANAGMATQFDPWLEAQIANDEFARQLVSATPVQPQMVLGGGQIAVQQEAVSPQAFYQAVGNTPVNQADAVSRYFLGVRLTCAQCHDHPFSAWKQEDFWGMAAFFGGNAAGQVPTINDETGKSYEAKYLWGGTPEVASDQSPRQALAEWLVAADNPNFSATAVNRIWQHLCGRGLVAAVDDLDQASDAERAMLDELGRHFAESGFNIQWLVSGICKSKFYQRKTVELGEAEGFARMRPLKTLTPEQMFDTLEQALSLPVGRVDDPPRHNGLRAAFVSRMNEAASDSPDVFRGGIPQALMVMNGKLTADATDLDKSRTLRAVVDAPFFSDEERIEALYLATLTRRPSAKELEFLLEHIGQQDDAKSRKQAFAEIMWSLLNSPEFTMIR